MAQSKSSTPSAHKKTSTRKYASNATAQSTRRSKAAAVQEESMDMDSPRTNRRKQANQGWLSILKQRRVFIPLVCAVIVVGLAYLAYKTLVFAWVGNTPLTKLELYNRMEKQSGKEMRDQLINEQLVLNEARKRGVRATDDDTNKQIANIEQQQGGKDQLDAALLAQQMTRADLKKQLVFSVLINKMFEADGKVDQKEVEDYLTQNKEELGLTDPKDASKSAQAKQTAEETLKKQKVNQAFSKWLQEAASSSAVKRVN